MRKIHIINQRNKRCGNFEAVCRDIGTDNGFQLRREKWNRVTRSRTGHGNLSEIGFGCPKRLNPEMKEPRKILVLRGLADFYLD